MVIIEMNPRVSRSSALASKATGFPIAKIAAKLAVGYRLDEIQNDITRKTPACFEPTIDYVVVKIPRWQFEKFPGAEPVLGTQMKSVGEVMAIGRTFKQALGKGMRSLETGKAVGCGSPRRAPDPAAADHAQSGPPRIHPLRVRARLHRGAGSRDDRHRSLVPGQVREMVDLEEHASKARSLRLSLRERSARKPKRDGSPTRNLARCLERRAAGGARSAARNWASRRSSIAWTPARRSSRASRRISIRATNRSAKPSPPTRKKVMILGSGPNRIGQGIEFDYCCCHASFALQEFGVESIMVNCNPETVSTDYDTSDRLYFEPLTLEEVLNIYDTEKPDGVIVQFGGQTPLNLALPLKRAGVPIIGTDPREHRPGGRPQAVRQASGRAEDSVARQRLRDQRGGSVRRGARASAIPVLVRPSYVLGGRAMVIAYDEDTVRRYMREAVDVLAGPPGADRPLPRRRHRSGCGCAVATARTC